VKEFGGLRRLPRIWLDCRGFFKTARISNSLEMLSA
jgi:hypothetical protein